MQTKIYSLVWLTVFVMSISLLVDQSYAAPVSISFAPASNVEISGAGPQNMVVGHYNPSENGDNHLDMVVTSSQGDGKYTALLGNGNGGFSDKPETVSFNAWGITQGLFNNDSFLDLAITNGAGQSQQVKIYLGDGLGSFTENATLNAGTFPISATSGLFNNDGFVDLVVGSHTGLSVFLGNGNGTFQVGAVVPGSSQIQINKVVVADFDKNGRPDLAIPESAFLDDGVGNFTRGFSFGGNRAIAVGDINNDGHQDAASMSSSQVTVWLGNGSGGFSFGSAVTAGSNLRDIAITDLNLDTFQDIVLVDEDSNSVLVFLGNGGVTFSTAQAFATGPEPKTVAIADWNEDGWPDIAVPYRNQGDTASVSILLQINNTTAADLIFQNHFEG